MAFENITGKTLTDAELARQANKDYIAGRGKVIFPAQQGQMPFIATDGTNNIRYDFAVVQGDFCQTMQEIDDAKVRVVSFKDVFNSWKRYSHNNVPTPANSAEMNAWAYDEATDSIKSTINSGTHIGLVSRTKYTDWELEVELSATDGDDDGIGIVLAFITDADGIEQSLTAWRSPGGSHTPWSITHNFANARAGKTVVQTFFPENRLALKWGSGNPGLNATEAAYTNNQNGGWNGLRRTKVHIKRVGNVFTCKTTDFELFDPTLTYVEAATIVLDLNANANTKIYSPGAAYGYCAYSQNAASWKVLKFVGGERVIYDIKTGVVYTDNGSGWVTNAERTITGDLGTGKMLFNRFTGKLFYVESEGEVYHLNAVPMV